MFKLSHTYRNLSGNVHPKRRKALPLIMVWSLALMLIAPLAIQTGKSLTSPPAAHADGLIADNFILDNVAINIQTPYLPGYNPALDGIVSPFQVAEPGNLAQTSIATGFDPYGEFSVTAAPFGFKPSIEDVPVAQSGGASAYQSAILNYRTSQGDTLQTQIGPTATIFGQQVTGQTSLANTHALADTPTPLTIVEWVVEAGKRLWIVRVVKADPQGTTDLTSSAAFLQSLNSLVVSSATLDNLTTLKADNGGTTESPLPPDVPSNLPFPPWWSGNCNVYHHAGSQALGATFRGLVACGPLGTLVEVDFHAPWPNVHQYEWQCAELVKRYLYLAYGVSPYSADGRGVVSGYSTAYGGGLTKIYNTGGAWHIPAVGDAMAYGTSGAGHTSVVTAVSVNNSGNGSLTVIQQNASYNGWGIVNISNWRVQSSVSGWLHKP